MDTLLGKKGKMRQAFVNEARVGVTKISLGPCVVTQIIKYNGHWGIQIGVEGARKLKNFTKPMKGHLKNKPLSFLREVRVDKEPELKVGDQVAVSDIFSIGDVVAVTGVSRGKGFAGVVKRWGFAGGPKTHGQSDRLRAPGSIGQGTTPGRVRKGKKMAGRMGGDTIRVAGLQIVGIDADKNEIEVSGPVPGATGGYLVVTKTGRRELPKLEVQEVVQQKDVDTEDTESAEKSEGGSNEG